jgi:hypothetical protein
MKAEDEDVDFDTDEIFRVSDARGNPERQGKAQALVVALLP